MHPVEPEFCRRYQDKDETMPPPLSLSLSLSLSLYFVRYTALRNKITSAQTSRDATRARRVKYIIINNRESTLPRDRGFYRFIGTEKKRGKKKVHAGELHGIALGINRGQRGPTSSSADAGAGRGRNRIGAKMWSSSSRPAVSRFGNQLFSPSTSVRRRRRQRRRGAETMAAVSG